MIFCVGKRKYWNPFNKNYRIFVVDIRLVEMYYKKSIIHSLEVMF